MSDDARPRDPNRPARPVSTERGGVMRVIIAGSRQLPIRDSDERVHTVLRHIEAGLHALGADHPDAVLYGGAQGVDTLGMNWAQQHQVPIEFYEPDWKTHGRAAGPLRNRAMAENADALILIWDGRSRGSANMRAEARRRGLPIYEQVIADGGA